MKGATDVDKAPKEAGRQGRGPEPRRRSVPYVMTEQKGEGRMQGKASEQGSQNT